MEHFYTHKKNIFQDYLIITEKEVEHITKVLRKKIGDELLVTDGEGKLYITVISSIAKDKIHCEILNDEVNVNEPARRIILFQSLLKNPTRFEFVIEKATELGVIEIIPLLTQNVVNKKTDRHARWQSITLSAMKQSQRCWLPIVRRPQQLLDALISCIHLKYKIIAHENIMFPEHLINEKEIPKLNSSFESCAVFVGPEGGFTYEEIEQSVAYGCEILQLGKRKLRSETATISILSLLFYAS